MPDNLFKARIEDTLRLSRKAPHFIGFLDPAERAEAETLVSSSGLDYLFFGGYEDADRVFLGVFPDYLESDISYFPITALTFSFSERFELSHRDFLGSLMALGLRRDALGDIIVDKDGSKAIVFVKDEIKNYITENIFKIGKVGVKITEGIIGELEIKREFENISTVIASERLDCIVGGLCGLSREKAATAIRSGLVQLNYRECDNVSQTVKNGSVLSVRGKGKFIIDDLEAKTKKGRTVLTGRKYK